MPGKVKVKIIAGKNLPVMDRSSDTTDAYVEVKLGSTTYKTDVCRKSLNPQWNSDWYRFEVDDSELQDEPLQIRLMDHDTYSANDAIGKVYLDLNPLLLPTGSLLPKFGCISEPSSTSEHVTNSVMSGWIPVYDTMHGIRGEVNVIVKVELFSDFNRFRQSSCGVQFFCSPVIPHGYYIQMFHGFVEELIVNDDPEYQWIDKIRTPRASNEARQTLFFKLSGELQRKIGVKALELGGNAVVGYSQCFDLEGESGVVVRGIGTAVTLMKLRHAPTIPAIDTTNEERALSYLQFLRHDSGFHLNRDSFKNPIQSTPFLSTSALSLHNQCDNDTIDWNIKGKRNFTRHLSYGDFSPPLKSAQSLNRVDNIHHASSLQTLLQQEEMRGNPGTGISQRIKNFKYSSQNMLAKKMTALKAKLSDSGMPEEDNDDLRGSVISLLDSNKKKSVLFQRSTSESNTMAELLVRSLMQTSLDCITETHDSTAASLSSSSSLENKDSAITSISSQDKIEKPICFLNKSISEPSNRLESQFVLDVEVGSSNADSSSDSSSTTDDEDEALSDVRDESNTEFDTVSNIIKNVTINNSEIPRDSSSIEVEDFEVRKRLSSEILDLDDVCTVSDRKDINDIAPLAESENFEIETRSPVHFLVGDEYHDNSSQYLERTESESTLLDVQPRESIIPHAKMDTETSQGLIQTAMKTILLDKLNIVGTYTPPSSPSLVKQQTGMFNFEEQGSASNLSTTRIQDQSFLSQNTNTFDFMRQSPTVLLRDGENSKLNDFELSDKLIVATETNSNDNHASDVLITQEEISDIPNFPLFPTDPVLTATNIDKCISNTSISCLNTVTNSVPVNTELDKGSNNMHASLAHSLRTTGLPAAEPVRNDYGHQRTESVGAKISQSPARFHPIPFMHRRSSDSDLSITPKGNSLTGSDKSYGLPSGYFSRVGALLRPSVPQENFDMLEYPFLTLTKYPPGFIIYLGGVVSARSVKLLERITNLEEPESRDTWWTELRMEIRSHARSIGCNAVLAYSEISSICDDVCVLSASGTAAVIGFQYTGEITDSIGGFPLKPKPHYGNKDTMASSLDRNDFEREKLLQKPDSILLANIGMNAKPLPESPENEAHPVFVNNLAPCTVCHLPYSGNSIPLRTTTLKCAVCRSGRVPDVLLATIEMPEGIPSMGRGCFIQAHVCRQLKDARSESSAKDISDGLPFLEYELHRILVNKIKIKGMNAVFGLKVRISIGVKMLVGIATGTGVFLLSLPPPPLPKLVSDRSTDEKKLAEMQKLLSDTVKINKEIYQIKISDDPQTGRISPDNENSEDDQPIIDLAAESRDCCILEVDDPEDMEIMNFLMEPRPPDGFHVVNTELVPGLEELEIVKNLQMFTQIWRAKLHPPYNLGKHVHKLLESVYFKLRRMIPCALCDLQFRVDLPESDEIQISIIGMALGLAVSQNFVKYKRKNVHISLKESIKKNDEDMIFKLEDDHPESNAVSHQTESSFLNIHPLKHRGKSPQKIKVPISKQHVPHRERHGVDITPLSYVPGGKIERYLGNLNFFFIRETTSIREEGGLSGFIHSFITEVLAIVRAHIAALGGNAMVAYYMTKCVLSHSVHKNQGQCLINVGGDVVFVSYFAEE